MTVSWEYPLADLGSSDKVMQAKFKAGGLPTYLMLVLGGAALLTIIGFVIVILIARK